jgi:hypothetical protein
MFGGFNHNQPPLLPTSCAALATHELRVSADALARGLLTREVGLARDAARATARTGVIIEESKAELSHARAALNALTASLAASRAAAGSALLDGVGRPSAPSLDAGVADALFGGGGGGAPAEPAGAEQ